jgi:hypothetical protein
MEAVVAAPGAVMGGLVMVEGVRSAVATARAAVGAGAAGPGVRWRGAVGAVTSPAGLLFAGAAAGLVLSPLAGLVGGAPARPVGGLLAGIGAEAALAAGVVGLAEAAPQVGQRWMTRTSMAAHSCSVRASRSSS